MGVARSQTVEDGAPRRQVKYRKVGASEWFQMPIRDEHSLVDYPRDLVVKVVDGEPLTATLIEKRGEK